MGTRAQTKRWLPEGQAVVTNHARQGRVGFNNTQVAAYTLAISHPTTSAHGWRSYTSRPRSCCQDTLFLPPPHCWPHWSHVSCALLSSQPPEQNRTCEITSTGITGKKIEQRHRREGETNWNDKSPKRRDYVSNPTNVHAHWYVVEVSNHTKRDVYRAVRSKPGKTGNYSEPADSGAHSRLHAMHPAGCSAMGIISRPCRP